MLEWCVGNGISDSSHRLNPHDVQAFYVYPNTDSNLHMSHERTNPQNQIPVLCECGYCGNVIIN